MNFLIKLIRKQNLDKGAIHNDFNKCVYCGKCQGCRGKAIQVNRKDKTWQWEDEKCFRCGYCLKVCPVKSLSFDK